MIEKLTDADRAALLDSHTALGKRIVRIIDQLTAALAASERNLDTVERSMLELEGRVHAAKTWLVAINSSQNRWQVEEHKRKALEALR